MAIDLPPHIEQAIVAKAERYGLTPAELLAQEYGLDDEAKMWLEMERQGLNSDGVSIKLTAEDARIIQDYLDNPPPLPPVMQKILAEIHANV